MAWTDYKFGRSAYAAAYICVMLLIEPTGVFRRLAAHVHQAFWCSVIEAAVLCPTWFRYLSKERPLTKVLGPFLSLFWSEVVCWGVARWMQLFAVHASVSPSLAGSASVALDRERESPYSILTQGVLYLCIVQIAHDITGVLRKFESTIQSEADVVIADAKPLFDDAGNFETTKVDFASAMLERLVYVYLAGQAFVYGCVAHLFATTALNLERIAAGTIVTAFINAHKTLTICWYYPFLSWASVILTAVFLNLLAVYQEAYRAAEDEWLRRHRELRAGERPPPPRGRRRPAYNIDIPWNILLRLKLRLGWVVEECFRWVVPWVVPWQRRGVGLGRWFCPEVAALWSEDELRRFYAAALTGVPSSVLAASWGDGPLRRRHVELWKRAGLTTDFVLVGGSAAGNLGGWPTPGMISFLGKVAAPLVRGLDATFAVFVVVGGIDIVVTSLREEIEYII